MGVLRHLASHLRTTHVALAVVVGIALQVFGFVGIAFRAFWAPFRAWGVCGDGASETCLRRRAVHRSPSLPLIAG